MPNHQIAFPAGLSSVTSCQESQAAPPETLNRLRGPQIGTRNFAPFPNNTTFFRRATAELPRGSSELVSSILGPEFLANGAPNPNAWIAGNEGIVVVSPHDDDMVIGIGALVRKAINQGVPVKLAIVTDGSKGYSTAEQERTIVADRERETYESCRFIGLRRRNIERLNFPDGDLPHRNGFALQQALAKSFRSGVPGPNGQTFPCTRIITTSTQDYHPDHQEVARAVNISIFHAIGTIWPELGKPLSRAPVKYSFPVYCKPNSTDIVICASRDDFEVKVNAVRAYRSQLSSIAGILEHLDRSQGFEFLEQEPWRLLDHNELARDYAGSYPQLDLQG